ncbi:hypothetical protein [Amycolatopsis sp. cmx-11-51]|uniref:hypothetical protein n=1 Tax=Amycolatopsis sp. cmx-11-51 TaxID=2785797 RepID=UPI0039E45CCA
MLDATVKFELVRGAGEAADGIKKPQITAAGELRRDEVDEFSPLGARQIVLKPAGDLAFGEEAKRDLGLAWIELADQLPVDGIGAQGSAVAVGEEDVDKLANIGRVDARWDLTVFADEVQQALRDGCLLVEVVPAFMGIGELLDGLGELGLSIGLGQVGGPSDEVE